MDRITTSVFAADRTSDDLAVALAAIGAEHEVARFRVIRGTQGQTVVWTLCDVAEGRGLLVGWDGGADLLALTKRPRPVAELLRRGVARGVRVLQDWTTLRR